jgi:hypothetical protein
MIKGMKAFRVDQQGQLRFLFHAYKAPGETRASSLVPLDQWIETKRPWGREAKGKMYRVAFHFLRDPERIENFKRMTKDKYVIIPILALGVEPKPRTSVGSWLAKRIFVSSLDVQQVLAAARE